VHVQSDWHSNVKTAMLTVLKILFARVVLPIGMLFDGESLKALLLLLNSLTNSGIYTTFKRLETVEMSPILLSEVLRCLVSMSTMCLVTIKDDKSGSRLQGASLFSNIGQFLIPMLRGPMLSPFGCSGFDSSKTNMDWPDGTPTCETGAGLKSAGWCLKIVTLGTTMLGALVAPCISSLMLIVASAVEGSKMLLGLRAELGSVFLMVFVEGALDFMCSVLFFGLAVLGVYVQLERRKKRRERLLESGHRRDDLGEAAEGAEAKSSDISGQEKEKPPLRKRILFIASLPWLGLRNLSVLINFAVKHPEQLNPKQLKIRFSEKMNHARSLSAIVPEGGSDGVPAGSLMTRLRKKMGHKRGRNALSLSAIVPEGGSDEVPADSGDVVQDAETDDHHSKSKEDLRKQIVDGLAQPGVPEETATPTAAEALTVPVEAAHADPNTEGVKSLAAAAADGSLPEKLETQETLEEQVAVPAAQAAVEDVDTPAQAVLPEQVLDDSHKPDHADAAAELAPEVVVAAAPDSEQNPAGEASDAGAREAVQDDDWVETVDPASGNVYYCNAKTGESSWTKPSALLS